MLLLYLSCAVRYKGTMEGRREKGEKDKRGNGERGKG
jgi:hypothetical protein